MARALATALLATLLVPTACGGEQQAQGESTGRKATDADRLHATAGSGREGRFQLAPADGEVGSRGLPGSGVLHLVDRRPFGRREGVLVYGDRDLWRWWVAQGFVFWLKAGPYEDSKAPDLDGLVPLIRASTELPPPG